MKKMQKKLQFVSETNKDISRRLLDTKEQNGQLLEMLQQQEDVISDLLWAVGDLKKHRLTRADKNRLSKIEWTVFDLKQSTATLMEEMCLKERQCSDWSEWSTCSVDCGTGSAYRSRECNSNRKFKSYCKLVLSETKTCTGNKCENKSMSNGSCPENFHLYQGYCLLFTGRRDSRRIATTICKKHHAHLVEIDSPQKQAIVSEYMQQVVPDYMRQTGIDYNAMRQSDFKYLQEHSHVGIDGIRLNRDADYRNWKSRKMTYFHWAEGQPRNGKYGKEYCITVSLKDNKWYLQTCAKRFYYICEVLSAGI